MIALAGSVAVLSPSGWGNLGDAAIVDSLVHAIRVRHPDVPIVGLTLNPPDTARRHGIPAYTCSGFSTRYYGVNAREFVAYPLAVAPAEVVGEASTASHASASVRGALRAMACGTPLLRELWSLASRVRDEWRHRRALEAPTARLCAIVVAGGGQLDDLWGGSFGHPYVLWRWARRARSLGAPFLVLSTGTGQLGTPLSRAFVRNALALAQYRSFRDETSRSLVGDSRLARDPVVPDLAYGLPAERLPADRPPGERAVIGISPMAHAHGGPVRDERRYRIYLGGLAQTSAQLLRQGHELVLYGTGGTDARCVSELHVAIARLVPPGLLARVSTPPVTTLGELFEALAGVQVCMASRLHGVVLAHLMSVPVQALSYERKVATLMSTMGHERFCLPIDDFEPRLVAARVDELLSRREELADGIARAVAGFRVRVQQQFDEVFGAVPGERRAHHRCAQRRSYTVRDGRPMRWRSTPSSSARA